MRNRISETRPLILSAQYTILVVISQCLCSDNDRVITFSWHFSNSQGSSMLDIIKIKAKKQNIIGTDIMGERQAHSTLKIKLHLKHKYFI